jgi:replicative DNA helicase
MFNVISPPGPVPFDKLPPQNLEAELCTLGSFLIDNAAIDEVSAFLRPEDFYRDSHQILCRRVFELRDGGSPVDAILLVEHLERRGEMERVGGDDAIRKILEAPPHAANAAFYAQIVRQKAVSRDLIEAMQSSIRDGYSNLYSADQLVHRAEEAVFAIGESRATLDVSDLATGLDQADAAALRRHSGEIEGVASGWRDVDDKLDGFLPGTLTIVAGRPSMGKSAFVHNILDHAAVRQGIVPFLVSLETTRMGVASRMKQARAMVDGYRIKKPWDLSADEVNRLESAAACLRQHSFPIDDGAPRTVSQVAANARRQKVRRGIGLVVIDHIQLLDGDDPRASRQEQMARISRRLKQLSVELNVPVIALSQLNRLVEHRDDHRPRMSDLRESGAIEQDADMVLMLHRPEYYDPNDQPGVAELIVAKNRDGATGVVKMAFAKQHVRFDGISHADEFGLPSEEF